MPPSRTLWPPLAFERGGDGPPMVLVHGLGLSRRCWSPVREALEQRHEVVAFDLPGFGESPPLPHGESPTPAVLADALAHEIDRLGLVAPAVVGNSLGGWLALELARRGLVSCAVAIAPSGLETPPERAHVIALNELMRARARLAAPLAPLITASLAARTVLFGGLRSRPWRQPSSAGERELRDFGCSAGFQAALWSSVGSRVPRGLGEIQVPTRIVYGTLDSMLAVFTAPRFAAAVPGAELVALPGLGHVPMSDDPELVARTILEFAGRFPARNS